MGNKELKITPPKGYCIDEANSTFECIKFKSKKLTYKDVANNIFKGQRYFITTFGKILEANSGNDYYDGNNGTSQKQLEKLLAINKLMNVAKYLNGDWKPDWGNQEPKFYPYISQGVITIGYVCNNCCQDIYFKSEELVQQAIDILGEDTIRLALSTDW